MKEKNGFTLVELIGVITILAILLVILIPAVTNVSENSKMTLRNSKINTLVTAGEEYGNELINDFQNCVGEGATALKGCTVPIKTLIANGYLEGEDDDENIIDPVTNSPMSGQILLCYNKKDVNVYGAYIENDNQYSCSEFSVSGSKSLNLSSISGLGYVGGSSINVNIITSGTFNSFDCSSSSSLATCRINGTTLEITPTKIQFADEEEKSVPIILTARHDEGAPLSKTYTLTIRPTKLSIIDPAKTDPPKACLPIATTDTLELDKLNEGELSVIPSDKEILEGTAKDGTLYIASKNKTGSAKLTVRESHGFNESSIERTIYELQVGTEKDNSDIPENLVINSTKVLPITYRATGSITITSTDHEVVHFSSPSNIESDTITIDKDTEFTIIAKKSGSAKIQIRGNDCGFIETDFSVSNLALDSTRGRAYTGGDSLKADIITDNTSGLYCQSSDNEAATCEVHATTLEIYPGNKPNEDVTLTIKGPAGEAKYHLTVLPTSIEIVDRSGVPVDKVCTERASGINDKELFVRGTNMGETVIDEIQIWELADAAVGKEGDMRQLTLENRDLTPGTGRPPFHDNFNGGLTKISVKEKNGYKTAALNYYIYDFSVNKESIAMKIDDEENIKVSTLATGEITAISSNPRVASVKVEPSSPYSFSANAINERTVKVIGESTGTAIITIRGAECGEKKVRVSVSGRSLSIKLEPGTYTTSVGTDSLSCLTNGIFRSCEVTLPEIRTTSEYNIVGYSTTKDSTTAEYKPGDKLTINYMNNGKTYYGNSSDTTNPVCTFTTPKTDAIIGATTSFDLTCIDTGSGIEDAKLDIEDFILSSNEIGEIKSVSSPMEIANGYSYKVEVYTKKTGTLNISLRAFSVVDRFGNGNSITTLSNIFASEYISLASWSVGKENRDDVLAVLYENSNIPDIEDSEGYTLKFYGTGEMLDFMSEDYAYQAPWYIDFHHSVKHVEFETGITNIGSYVLYNAGELKTLKIPETITKIGDYAFANANLQNIDLPSSIRSIGDYAFYNNSSLSTLQLSIGLETIGKYAFYEHNLEALDIPSSVTKIGDYAFANSATGSMSLKTLHFEEDSNLEEISEGTFQFHSLETVSIPSAVTAIKAKSFAQFDMETSSTLKEIDFKIDSNLKIIGDEAFYQSSLESLSLPSKLESIGTRAFIGLKGEITSLTIPKSVENIGNEFVYGSNLEEFIVEEENSNYTSVNGVLYTKDLSTLIKCPDDYYKKSEVLDVPEETTTIEKGAFKGWLDFGDDIAGFTLNLPSNIANLNLEENFILFTISQINIAENETYSSENGVLFNKDKTVAYRLPPAYNESSYTIPDTVEAIEDDFAYGNFKVKEITIPETVTSIGSYAFQTDSEYGLKTINLYTPETLTYDITSFALMTFENTTSIHDQKRTINIKSDELKTKLETTYEGAPYTIELILES